MQSIINQQKDTNNKFTNKSMWCINYSTNDKQTDQISSKNISQNLHFKTFNGRKSEILNMHSRVIPLM